MNYRDRERLRSIAWKKRTPALPDAAKVAATYLGKDGTPGTKAYDFCLPVGLAEHTLLPEVRERALRLFTELGIPWHAGTPAGPSNHLVSSQVQCVNALTPMITEPGRLVAALGDVLDIDEVLPIEPGRHLTFEYIGPHDFFGEAPRGQRIRGAHCTSLDAAFLHRSRHGHTELVLLEWKYTEFYGSHNADQARNAVRARRYGEAVRDPHGPVRADLLPLEPLFDEPFYQLVRQQLLAHALETSHAHGADRVRVLHVLPPANHAYQVSLPTPEHHALGATVDEAWQRLLRTSDRFVHLDPAVFLDPAITSPEYASRYGEPVIADETELLRAFGIDDVTQLEDSLDVDGDITATATGIELITDGAGTALDYPFGPADVHELATDEHAAHV